MTARTSSFYTKNAVTRVIMKLLKRNVKMMMSFTKSNKNMYIMLMHMLDQKMSELNIS